MGASSGALNGTTFAAGVRSRREKLSADLLVKLWRDSSSWRDVLDIDVRGLLSCRGLSSQRKLRALLRRAAPPSQITDPAPIDLYIIVAPLNGVETSVGAHPATTHVKVLSFGGEHFDHAERLEEVFTAATASSAFPYLFVPVNVGGLGPAIDGGIVDGTPLREIYGNRIGSSSDTVILVAPTPTRSPGPGGEYTGLGIAGHLIDMLFSERAYEDMREVHWTNAALRGIEDVAHRRGWGSSEVDELKAAIGWPRRRQVQFVSIRPTAQLPGGILSGFWSADIREQYIELGKARANQVFDDLGW